MEQVEGLDVAVEGVLVGCCPGSVLVLEDVQLEGVGSVGALVWGCFAGKRFSGRVARRTAMHVCSSSFLVLALVGVLG